VGSLYADNGDLDKLALSFASPATDPRIFVRFGKSVIVEYGARQSEEVLIRSIKA